VSTLLINCTISAKLLAFASAALKIASILPFSVVILPSNSDLIAFLSVEAEPLSVFKSLLIASLAVEADWLSEDVAAFNSASST